MTKEHYKNGKSSEVKLVEVMSREAEAVTPTAKAAELLRQWEDLRATTGVGDWFMELGVDVDSIREEAERYYRQTKDHYGDALRVESEARAKCLADIKDAYKSIPDFRSPVSDPGEFLKNLGPLQAEARQASSNPYAQLPGTGTKVDAIPTQGSNVVANEALTRIQTRSTGSLKPPAATTGCRRTRTTSAASTSPTTRSSSRLRRRTPACRPK